MTISLLRRISTTLLPFVPFQHVFRFRSESHIKLMTGAVPPLGKLPEKFIFTCLRVFFAAEFSTVRRFIVQFMYNISRIYTLDIRAFYSFAGSAAVLTVLIL